jgi:hypothetical protein
VKNDGWGVVTGSDAMPNTILLLGAGFSYNWNGRLVSEVTNDLMSHLQGDDFLLDLLHRQNFEDALSLLQRDYRASGKPEDQRRLRAFQVALSKVCASQSTSRQQLARHDGAVLALGCAICATDHHRPRPCILAFGMGAAVGGLIVVPIDWTSLI